MPAIYLFGKRTLLGGDDLHVPAFATVIVRLIQLSFLILPLSIYIWKEAITIAAHRNSNTNDNDNDNENDNVDYDWPIWKYLFDWWDEIDGNGNGNGNGNDDGQPEEAPPACTESYFSRYYPFVSTLHLLFSTIFCFFSLSLEYQIWHWSCQGTPTMRQPRTMKVQELLERKIGIFTVLLALIVATTYFFAASCFARPYHRCYIHTLSYHNNDNYNYNYNGVDDDANDDDDSDDNSIEYWVGSRTWYALGALLAVSQTAEVVVATLFYARLASTTNEIPATRSTSTAMVTNIGDNSSLPLAHTTATTIAGHYNQHHHHHELTEELWADRCQSLFRCLSISTCFLFGGHDIMNNAQRNNSYRHVAQALADYLETKGTLDVVPTDLFTGLLILQRIQRQRVLQTRRNIYEESSSSTSTSTMTMTVGNGCGGYGGGGAARGGIGAAGPSSSTSLDNYNHPTITNNNYHHITSPDNITNTGLRSRVATRSPSPSPIRRTLTPTPITNSNLNSNSNSNLNSNPILPAAPHSASPILNLPGTTSQSMMTPETNQAVSVLVSTSSSSSEIRPPPPQQHKQQRPQQQQCQQNIYRRRDHSSPITTSNNIDTNANLSDNTNNGGSFYRATSRQVLNPVDPVDASTLEEGARMCDYALSIYTWMLYVFVHPVTGFPRLICQCGSGSAPNGAAVDCCRSCCCKVCGILQNRRNPSSPSPTSTSIPLRQRRRTAASGEPNDTNHQRQPLFPSTTAASSTTPTQTQSQVPFQTNSDEYSEDDENYDDDDRDCGDPRTAGDNLCEWHKRALLLVAGIPEADLVYAQFNNRLSSVPYCILLDHERSLVVLSVRGSLSLEDVVTDTLVLPVPLEELGDRYGFDGREQYCHAGVLGCFENVLRDLQRYGWLERLLERDYPDYNLRIVGHSLGAGVCTLLGYVLRSKYPSLKVFGFSPPGCTMTWELATNCKAWSTSFVLDSDIVPRLSVLALEGLRDEVLELIGRIKVPKYKVFETLLKGRDGRKGCVYGSDGRNDDSNNAYYDDDLEELTQVINETLDDVPRDTIYQRQLRDFLRVQDQRKEARGETNSRSLRLYPPGKMIHLLKTGEEGGCAHLVNKCLTCCTSNSGFLYTPVYISNDDLDEIVVTATMGTDHFIDRMCDELHKISKNYSEQGATTAVDRGGLGNGIIV